MRSNGVIVAGLVLTGLLAAGCGTSGSARPAGAAGAGGTPSETAPAPARVVTTTTQTVHLGPLTEDFDSPLPPNPAQASVVRDFRMTQVLWDESTNGWAAQAPIAAYVTGDALVNLDDAIAAFKRSGDIETGSDRLFRTRVTALTGSTATLATCDDGGAVQVMDKATGKPDPAISNSPEDRYLLLDYQMGRLDGHWAITAVSPVALPDPRAQVCQP